VCGEVNISTLTVEEVFNGVPANKGAEPLELEYSNILALNVT
jgi:hypothetical protein